MKIENSNAPFEIDVKRFYFPAVLRAHCPTCGKECVKDGEGDYLSYPKTNTPTEVNFYCHSIVNDVDVEHEFSKKIILRVTIEEVSESA
jgi:hypothetical protein